MSEDREYLIKETFNDFFSQFGEKDVYSTIVIEELLKAIYENLSISGAQRQKGN